MKSVSALVTAYALILFGLGIFLLFAPASAPLTDGAAAPGVDVLTQPLGAALIGFGTANWTARGSFLGGIYGRAVVAGNQAFAFVATLSLLAGRPDDAAVGFWILFMVLAAGAVLFSVLLFRPPAPTAL